METSINETKDEKKHNDIELKKECFNYARKNFQGKFFTNIDTGRSIGVSRDGLDEWFNKTRSRDQSLSIKKLDKLLENGRLASQAEDNKKRQYVEGFLYLLTPCAVNGTNYNAVISIKQTKDDHNPDKFYHYYLQDIKIEPHSGIGTSSENPI